MSENEIPLHVQQAEGLEKLAAMIRQNPEVAKFASLGDLYAFHVNSAEDHATMIRAALKAGAKVDKQISESLYNVVLRWGPVGAMVLANRNDVCERVQVGTETVTREVRDEDAVAEALADIPVATVTEEVPVYEWECKPLLAAGSDGAA
jgi:hypothetical protein